jgi:hypothetical protein
MRIQIFQSGKGDCLLIEDAARKHRLLADGGTPGAMKSTIAKGLAPLQKAKKKIDLCYISHIDSDHIGGIAALLDLMMQWKVFDFHAAHGDPSPEPDLPRPPDIGGIWHNAFRDIIDDNQGDVDQLLAASAPLLQASQVPDLVRLGHEYAAIATSIPEALTVSRLIKPDRLGIGLNVLGANPAHSGKLLMARAGQAAETVGTLNVRILCPTGAELKDLRKGWNNWLEVEKNRKQAHKIRDLYADQLENAALDGGNPIDLGSWQGVADYKGVTVPNVASTVLLVEEHGKTLLLTGDNHPDKILAGLKDANLLQGPNEFIHLNVLKYPHHGATHNFTPQFSRQVSADHYLFCGDGSDTNPEIEVVNAMFESRIGPASKRVFAPQASGRRFKFWFSTSPESLAAGDRQDHMNELVTWAKQKKQQNPGVFSFHFGTAPSKAFSP